LKIDLTHHYGSNGRLRAEHLGRIRIKGFAPDQQSRALQIGNHANDVKLKTDVSRGQRKLWPALKLSSPVRQTGLRAELYLPDTLA
jgi:hypothetical protein